MANVRVYGGGAAKAPSASKEGSPLLAGILTGVALLIAWVAVARITHNDVGLAAWGVGGLLGIAVAKAAKPPTKATGALAAVLAIVTVFFAKVVLVVVALQPILRQELANTPSSLTMIFLA